MQELRPKQLSGQVAKHFNRKEKVYGQFWTPQVVADFYSIVPGHCDPPSD